MKKLKVIDMVERKGTFVPSGSHYEITRASKPNRAKEHQKAMPPANALNKIFEGFVVDFFRAIKKEMFR